MKITNKIVGNVLSICVLILYVESLAVAEVMTPNPDDVLLKISKDDVSSSLSGDQSPIQTARELIMLAQRNSDPRLYGRAEAVLQKVDGEQNEQEAKLLQAMVLQFKHQFSDAISLLDQIITESPHHAQARLTRAELSLIEGNYLSAKNDCEYLRSTAHIVHKVACLASSKAVFMDANEYQVAKIRLFKALTLPSLSDGERNWLYHVLIDLAVMHQDWQFVDKLVVENSRNQTVYFRTVYSDALLMQGRYHDLNQWLVIDTENTGLLTRKIIASFMDNGIVNENALKIVNDRILLSQQRSEHTFLHEQILLSLYISSDYKNALRIAKENWENSKLWSDSVFLSWSAKMANEFEELSNLEGWLRNKSIVVSLPRMTI